MTQPRKASQPFPSVTVFKGGTAFNGMLPEFQRIFPNTTYIVPITDDGGSSREIRRVFGGPSIGDLRSTLTRLSDESTPEGCAVKKLLEHRLSADDPDKAMQEWLQFLENTHSLYISTSSRHRGLIRHFLCKFEEARLQRSDARFDMRNGSIGNFFFSGARMALGSLEAAIFMYSSVAQIPPTTRVLPIVESNEQLGIGVRLENDELLIGQHAISHPDVNGKVDKSAYAPLSSPIQALFYIDKNECALQPLPHSEVLQKIAGSHGIVYGMGSLWTSIIPSLVLEGVGEAIASLAMPKIALMNCCHDRETEGMTALDYIHHITSSLNRYGKLTHSPKAFITHLFIVEGSTIPMDEKGIEQLGLSVFRVPADANSGLALQNRRFPIYGQNELISGIAAILNRDCDL